MAGGRCRADFVSCTLDGKRLIKLHGGNLLVTTSLPTTVTLPGGAVELKKGSVALIVASAGVFAVYNLHDQKKDSVVVTGDSYRKSLMPGNSVLLAPQCTDSFAEVNPLQLVGYRRIAAQQIGKCQKMFSADFAIDSAIQSLPVVAGLIHSPEPEAKRLGSSMIKTLAILYEMGSAEPYEKEIRSTELAFGQ